MASASRRGGESPPRVPARPARRQRTPDLSLPAAVRGASAPRLLEPAELWPSWTDRKTAEAGDWRLGRDDAAVPADEWPAWTDDIAFVAVPPPPLETTRIYPKDGPLLSLRLPERSAE